MSDPLARMSPVERKNMFVLKVDVEVPCASMPLKEADKLFFSESPKRIATAKALCADCPMLDKCLQFAIEENIEFGIYGGTTPAERKALINA